MGRKLLAEFVGTFALIFIGAGSIVASGIALPQAAVPGAGLITIALAHGLTIATMVTAVGHVSGGHFNPAVTVGAWVTRRIGTGEGAAYVLTQLAGGAAGALVLRLAVPAEAWEPARLGATLVAEGLSDAQAITIEAVLTFFLVWMVFATAVDPEGAFGKIAGLAIGLVIAMDIMMGGPFTGASMNPARSFGPALVAGEWTGLWVYFIGPVLGGTVAALLYDLGIIRQRTT
ncbi:MAG TPA: MIP family channel protein [Actinomycetota bacterium]|nr:MIP family channel protein [Actinomycetota bacterium]